MKKAIVTALLGVVCLTGSAQNEIDALRYSFTSLEGSARFMGLGGAFGSLGADVSAISINPAAMGRFSKNEFSFSLGTSLMEGSTDFYNTNTRSSRTNLNVPNIGFVGTHNFKKRDQIGWQSIQFGITYNRLNNFNEDIVISGQSPNSYSFVFADWAEGTPEDDLYTTNHYDSYLAYQTYLIDPAAPGSTTYFSTIRGNDGVDVIKNISRRGNMSSTELALSGNYMNKLYIGGSIGIPAVRFSQISSHREDVINDTINELEYFIFDETLTTRGSGFNFKAGFIMLPVDWLRLGASIQTPTVFRLTDRWQNEMSTQFDDGQSYNAQSETGSYTYKLRTPMRVTGSASVVLLKKAAISVDYELVNYSRARLGSTPYTPVPYEFTSENEAIGNVYQSASSIRVGAEVKVAKPFMVRAGAQYRQNPITEASAPQMSYSGGFGFRSNRFYLDMAYVLTTSSDNYYLYDPALVQEATINKNVSRVVATVGFRY